MRRRNPNAWRWNLDPRDPEYQEPPGSGDEEDDEPPEPKEYDPKDPRGDGPKHYQPPREP